MSFFTFPQKRFFSILNFYWADSADDRLLIISFNISCKLLWVLYRSYIVTYLAAERQMCSPALWLPLSVKMYKRSKSCAQNSATSKILWTRHVKKDSLCYLIPCASNIWKQQVHKGLKSVNMSKFRNSSAWKYCFFWKATVYFSQIIQSWGKTYKIVF